MRLLFSYTVFRSALLISIFASAVTFFAMISHDGSENAVALHPEAIELISDSTDFLGTSATETPIPESICDDVRARHPGLPPPLSESIGTVLPSDGSEILAARAYVLLDFHGLESPIDVTAMRLDGEDVLERLDVLDSFRFVYWARLLDLGCHVVEVEIQDATGKSFEFASVFNVRDRRPFAVPLSKGWNLISFPSPPLDDSIESVFAAHEVTMVASFDSVNFDTHWRVASRDEVGIWSKFGDFELLEEIDFIYGYWVFSNENTTLYIHLQGDPQRDPTFHGHFYIDIADGWNLFTVWDIVDYDQTEDNFGEILRIHDLGAITAGEYLGDYSLAYIWDAESKRFVPLEQDDFMRIGYGVWVHYVSAERDSRIIPTLLTVIPA